MTSYTKLSLSSSSLSQEKEMIRKLGQMSSRDAHFSSKIIKEEIFAAKTMRTLTARFGTRGKSAKSIFLQGFRDEVMGRGKKQFQKILRQKDVDDVHSIKAGVFKTTMSHEDQSAITNSQESSKIIIRPAVMVLYSKFCSRLEMLVKNQIFHLGFAPPLIETSWLYDDARMDSFKLEGNETSLDDMTFEVINVNDLLDETEERMVLRLKIYKRAFSSLILHCEALRPILREIKRSYDSVLKLRERQLQEIGWTSQNILTAEKDVEDKIGAVGFEGYGIIKLMDNQCKQLMRHIDKQDAAIRVMTDILNTLENALGEQHEMRRDSDDQNKMFVNDINHLRLKLGMTPRPEEGLGEVTKSTQIQEDIKDNNDLFIYTPDDPMILRKSLDIARHDLTMANKRLEELEEHHKNEIPRHRFEEMKKMLAELDEKHEKLKVEAQETQEQVQGTKDQIEKLTIERDDLKKQAAELRLKITPRPSWEKVGEFIDGGLPAFKSNYQGKTSIEISNKIIEELNAKKTASAPEYLIALGDDQDIPRCLRYDKRVRDRRLQRRDAEVIIQDIWKSRMSQLDTIQKMLETSTNVGQVASMNDFDQIDEIPTVTNFPEYVAQYFEDKFPNLQRRMEWTYNLVDACKRLSMNQKLDQFYGVLMSRIDEGCYHLLRSELSRLQNILNGRSNQLGHHPGSMTLGDFRNLIKEIYPHKNEQEIKSLVRVTSKQLRAHADWTMIKFDNLFDETDEGFEGQFVDEFAKQLDQDRGKYVHEMIQGLLLDLGVTYDYHEKEDDSVGNTEVHMKQFYKTLIAVDAEISEASIGSTLAWVYTRTSTLPGLGPKGLPMVNYLKSHLGSSLDTESEVDDLEFSKALQELKSSHPGRGSEGEEVGHKHGTKVLLSQAKLVKLRVLIRRLKEGALMDHSTKLRSPPTTGLQSRYPGEKAGEFYDEYEEEEEEEHEDEL